MKMVLTNKDIYDIQIEDIELGYTVVGCQEGYDEFDVDIEDVYSDDDEITIDISGTCEEYGYHNPIDMEFSGTLKMDMDDFNYEYTNAAEHGRKYINFDGDIDIKLYNDIDIDIDYDLVIDETFRDTITNIRNSYCDDAYDESIFTDVLIREIISEMNKDKIIKEIENIDNIHIEAVELYKYLIDNVIDDYTCEFEDEKYKSLDPILLSELTKLIKNDTVKNIIEGFLEDTVDESEENINITARVFLSDLDL